MSQEDDFMCDDDEEYDLQYSEESNDEPDVDLENQYYNSKALKEDDPDRALENFQKVLDLEGNEKGEWGFKALKQMIKIYFKRGQYEKMMHRYKQLLTYIKSAVTRNYSEKSINSILDYISSYSGPANSNLGKDNFNKAFELNRKNNEHLKNLDLLQEFYEATLQALKEAKNERLWFKTNTNCQTDDGEDDLKKGTQLLEIYALEIQVHTAQRNNKKLKQLYENCLHIKSAIPHPLIMGVIRECGGKMHLREHEFEKAHVDFFEAFKNYDESGSSRRTACLKYLVLANMLMKSGINPFDSQEAKPYKNDPEIIAMTDLVTAYQNGDIVKFESVLERDSSCNDFNNSIITSKDKALVNRISIMDDPFIREHVEELLKNIRTQVLMKCLVKPYTRVKIKFLADKLNVRDGVLPEGCKVDQMEKTLILVSNKNENVFLKEADIPNLKDKDDLKIQNVFSHTNKISKGNYFNTNFYEDKKYQTFQKLNERLLELQQALINRIA
ncbi:unnamed protein product [Gordionus sp. m RMFG-2023]